MDHENENPDTQDDGLQDAIDSGLVKDEPQVERRQPDEPPADDRQGGENKDDAPKSALEAVRRALDGEREKKAEQVAAERQASPKEGQDEAGNAGDDADEKPDDKADILTEEEYRKLPPRVRRRLGRLGAEAKAERIARESLEPRARMYDDMENFVRASGMTQEQFDNGLRIMAWTVSDPIRAYEALKPIFNELQAHMGERLPPDLQEQVDDGRIAPEIARELVFERSQRALLESQARQQRETQEAEARQREQQEKYEAHRGAVMQAITTWESGQKQSDPDYARKAQMISDRATIMVQNEQPATPEALVAVLNRAKAMVDRQLPPPRRPINPVNTVSAHGQARPAPKSALEAVTMGIEAVSAGQ